MSLIEKYQLAFDISPVPLLLVASDGRILLANSDFLELFEYEWEELKDLSVDALVPAPIRGYHPELRKAYHRVATKRNMGAGRDLHGVTKSGTVIPLELGLEPVTDGEDTLALVAAIDISHRKESEDRMRRVIDAAASAMVMVDESSKIVFVNKAASGLFGYEEADLMNKPVEMLVPDEIRRAHPVYTSSFMTNQSERAMGLGRDLHARHADGRLIPVEIVLTPVDTPSGKLVMSTISDLSERIAAADEVSQKNAELASLNTELSHFAYSASHDLKAPLSSITGLLKICIEDLEDNALDEVAHNLAKAVNISHRSAEKVEGVLRIARAGRDGMQKQQIDLEPTIRDIWLDLTGDEGSTRLDLDLRHTDPIVTELATLTMILENMLSNALRYGDDKKDDHHICIQSETIPTGVQLKVCDNGLGISASNQSKVFEMFKKLDSRSGDGLGLNLVRKQIERLGGTITLNSQQGVGSEFTVTLPSEGVAL